MRKKIGFIGCGNMGSAMVGGLIKSGFQKKGDIIVSARTQASVDKIKNSFDVFGTIDNKYVAKNSDIVVFAVKPNMYKNVVEEVKEELTKDKLIITIAAGISISNMEEWLGSDAKVIRTMPNTPALVGEAMSGVCPNKNVSEEELKFALDMFSSFGECVELAEKDFHAFTGLCGSSPAYVFMFIEAMADGAVKMGIPRAKAYKMAAQSVLGSAKMVLDTGKHPGELKDMVCSPAGTTIEAVEVLESLGFRNAAMQAVIKCSEKSQNM